MLNTFFITDNIASAFDALFNVFSHGKAKLERKNASHTTQNHHMYDLCFPQAITHATRKRIAATCHVFGFTALAVLNACSVFVLPEMLVSIATAVIALYIAFILCKTMYHVYTTIREQKRINKMQALGLLRTDQSSTLSKLDILHQPLRVFPSSHKDTYRSVKSNLARNIADAQQLANALETLRVLKRIDTLYAETLTPEGPVATYLQETIFPLWLQHNQTHRNQQPLPEALSDHSHLSGQSVQQIWDAHLDLRRHLQAAHTNWHQLLSYPVQTICDAVQAVSQKNPHTCIMRPSTKLSLQHQAMHLEGLTNTLKSLQQRTIAATTIAQRFKRIREQRIANQRMHHAPAANASSGMTQRSAVAMKRDHSNHAETTRSIISTLSLFSPLTLLTITLKRLKKQVSADSTVSLSHH